jgi:hypothetical protein
MNGGSNGIERPKSSAANVDIDAKQFYVPSKMHKEIRNDPEVSAKLEELEQAAKKYMGFDMQKL